MNNSASPTPQFGPREQTREQRQFIINQSLGITRSQGPYEVPAWQAELHEQYIAGEIDMQHIRARTDAHRDELLARAGEPTPFAAQ
ncbi:hypothetical protein [Hymenobacter algoricola]|uniref:Antitoxin VbhA domain-containing protein n=1 Tax=Hymenobacter algoricola TaxID=486267 RepID=A0ABP7MXC7_9BACT